MSRRNASPAGFLTAPALAVLLGVYAVARLLEITPTSLPRTAIVALDVLSALGFALVDGARHYRLRGILVFAAICAVVGNMVENVGVATGFPFGRYSFADLMGPKLFHVPVLLGLAYIGMAYVSWTLGRVIVGDPGKTARGSRLVALPLAASFIMVAWDLAQGPVWATVLHGWVWQDGGPWFGVPLSNYLGWFGTAFTIYLLFAIYLHRYPPTTVEARPLAWRPALSFYGTCAAGNVLQTIPATLPAVVADPTGKAWRTADITGTGFDLRDGGVCGVRLDPAREVQGRNYKLKSSRRRRVWARLTGISVCFLSVMRSW